MCRLTKAIVIFSLLTLLKVNGEEVDDLVDFEFETQTPSDYEYIEEVSSGHRNTLIDDLGDVETDSEPLAVSFHTKEQKVRAALMKAWANMKLRQKFAEILPILRMLSSQQRTALAALVSAQVNAKPGRELNLNQVKSMFGDRKDLILPLVLDIANLVRFAATPHYSTYDTFFENEPIPQAQLLRRSFTQSTVESDERNEVVNTTNPMLNIRDDRLSVEEDEGVIVTDDGHRSPRQSESRAFLVTREPHYDKLIQLMPQFDQKLDKDDQKSAEASDSVVGESQTLPITLTRSSPIEKNLTLEEIEDLAFESLNGTEATESQTTESGENLPTPEMLIGRHRNRKKPPPSFLFRKPPLLSSHGCEKFTGNICLRVDDYPMDQIMGSIRRHSYAMNALLAEYSDKAEELDTDFTDDLLYEAKRREDVTSGQPGAMCNSVIRYARPQKARSATGEWKYIVNTGKHTQTLRLEKCSNAQESCTYLTENFRSRCVQVFNYHRLLSWDNTRGLHVDIFKVPTCCSCRIDGYRDAYPPVVSNPNQYSSYKDSTTNLFGSPSRTKPYSSLDNLDDYEDSDDFEDLDDEDEDDDIAYQFGDGFKRIRKPHKSIVSSSSVPKIRVDHLKIPGSPSLSLQVNTPPEPYLSPPLNEFGELVSFKRGPFTGKRRKRPTSRIDQNLSGSVTQYQEITPPSTLLTTITERPKRRSTVTTRPSPETTAKISPRLPNTGLESDGGSSRVNYNYHPIIEFFENGAAKGGVEVPQAAATGKESRIGASSDWQPMIGGKKRL